MKWVDFATFYIPVFGKMDMAISVNPFTKSLTETFSSDYVKWLGTGGVNLAIAESYLAVGSVAGGPLDTFAFRRALPLQVGGNPWFAAAPPPAGLGWLGGWGGSFATADRFIPIHTACSVGALFDLQKHLGPATEKVILPNGKTDYEVEDVSAEYFAAKGGAFPNPITYFDSVFPTPKAFNLFPAGAKKSLVLRFGFSPDPTDTVVTSKNGVPTSLPVTPFRFTLAKVRVDQLVA